MHLPKSGNDLFGLVRLPSHLGILHPPESLRLEGPLFRGSSIVVGNDAADPHDGRRLADLLHMEGGLSVLWLNTAFGTLGAPEAPMPLASMR